MRRSASVLIALTLPFIVGTACGNDDDSSTSAAGNASDQDEPTASASDESTDDTGSTESWSPTDEFCDAQKDLAAAQDGAQRNTAIGEMQDTLDETTPVAIHEALNLMLTRSVGPEDEAKAQATLADACA